MKKTVLGVLLIALVMVLSGCLPNDGTNTLIKPAGFFWGVWHGWMAPLSLLLGLFNKTTRIYEIYNTGWLYDFGFYIAVISGFGGLSLSRKKKRKKNRYKNE